MFPLRFRETLHFWWHNLWSLFAVTAPFALLSLLIEWHFGAPYTLMGDTLDFHPLPMVLLLVLWPLASATLVAQLAAVQSGKPQFIGMYLLVAIRTGPALLLASLAMSLLSGIGLLFLILPGLWIYARLAMLPFVLVLEGKTPLASLRESFALSRSQQWLLLFGLVFLTLLAFSSANLIMTALAAIPGLPGWAVPIISALGYGLLSTLTDIYVFRFYLLARTGQSADLR